jgi:hypothetical protein
MWGKIYRTRKKPSHHCAFLDFSGIDNSTYIVHPDQQSAPSVVLKGKNGLVVHRQVRGRQMRQSSVCGTK